MEIVVDCHVHLYPVHDEGLLFETALKNLDAIAHGATAAVILAERSGQHRFQGLHRGANIPAGFTSAVCDNVSVQLNAASGGSLLVVAGRQIATAERLEVLSFFSTAEIEDRLPFEETIARVRAGGGVPVLTWAPGKWSGSRGEMVLKVLKDPGQRPLLLCDTSLRPFGWPEPAAFKVARTLGVKVLAGTDPLPIVGDEMQVGRFGIFLSCADQSPLTGEKLRSRLLDTETALRFAGRRNLPLGWALRYGRFTVGNSVSNRAI